ncbi:MAG TPA: hypothetical protein PKY82_18975 [Pyrinomonadaceae bacterium]|nr:hypothetical protein [Pyrinomonadaceae bacterium]
MNISNILYAFTEDLVSAAGAGTPLKDVQIHADIYEEIKPGKTIRVDDVRSSKPVLIGSGEIREDNAFIPVHFLKMPETQKLADRLAARQAAEDMATEWLKAYFNNPKLPDTEGNNRVCNIGEVNKFNDWIRPGTVKIPVCVLRLLINPS